MLEKLKEKLIADWRKGAKFWSVRLSAAGAVLMATWTELPPDLRAELPYVSHLAAGLFIAVAMSRFISQGSKDAGQ